MITCGNKCTSQKYYANIRHKEKRFPKTRGFIHQYMALINFLHLRVDCHLIAFIKGSD